MSNNLVFTQGVALLRNYAQLPFPHKMTEEELDTSLSWVKEALSAHHSNSTQVDKFLLNEIPLELFGVVNAKAVHIYKINHSTQLLINAENGLSIVSTSSDLNQALMHVKQIEADLFKEHEAAFLSGTGYLTTRYGDSGSGVRIFQVLHLPVLSALRKEQSIRDLMEKNFQSSLEKVRISGAGQEGNLYFLSTIETPEGDGIARLKLASTALTEQEKEASTNIFSNHYSSLYDTIWRSLGLLTHARRLYQEETIKAWSCLRMGAENDILPLTVEQVDRLLETYCIPKDHAESLSALRSERIRVLLKEYENASNGTFNQ